MLKYIQEDSVNNKMLAVKRVAKTILSLLPLGIVAGVVLGCSNLGMGGGVGNASVASKKGVVVRVAMPGQSYEARSAMPNFENAEFVFAGTITASGATPSFKAATYNSTDKTVTFAFDVSTEARADYVLGVYAFPSGTTLGTSTAASAATLSGTTTITIPANAFSLTVSDPIVMKPNFTSSGTGNVELAITIPNDYTLACDDAGFSYSSGKITATDIEAGAHAVTFSLKKTGETVATYVWKETIVVYAGLTTDTWNTGTTKTINGTQIFSTFYVRGTGGSWISELASISAAGNDETGDGSLAKPYATVQKAIDRIIAINDGNTPFTIYVDGTITAESGKNVAKIETGNKAQKLSIIGLGNTKSVFTGNDASVVIVRANYANNDSTLTMQNIKITGGTSVCGGGIDAGQDDNITTCGGTINLIDCEISGNSAKTGGGISFVAEQAGNATLTLNNCIVTKNTAQYGGGIYAWRGKVALENGTVIGDKSSALTSAVAGNNCGKGSSGIGGNKAVSDDASVIPNGGGITLGKNNKSLEVDSGCYISGNYCDGGTGGGICIQNNTTTTLILNAGAKIQYNSAESGGGIHTTSAITISDGVEIIGNSATNGGGIYSSGTLSITGGKISANTGDLGGGILNLGTIDFTDGTIGGDDTGDANVSPMGGGIANLQTLNIKGGVVKGNIAKNNEVNQGGGIYNIGTITMTSGSISKNSVEGQAASSQGGGIYNAAMSGHYGTVTIKGGTISGNKAGLGAAVFNSGVFEMQGGTIGGDESEDANIAANAGGALYNNSTQDDAVKISGGFIKGNKAALGGAIINYNDVSISGGLFSGNTATASLSNGICNYGTSLTLSGSFQFSDDDDIFLALDEAGTGIRAITIGGEITGTAPVAKIVPYGYGEGITVLKSSNSTILSSAVPKFTLAQPASGTKWKINAAGNLEKDAAPKLATVYLNSATTNGGSDTNTGATASNAVATLKKAVEILDQNDGNPTIIICSPYTLASSETDCLEFEKTVTLKRGENCKTNLLTINTTTGSNVTVPIKNVVFDGNKSSVSSSTDVSSLLCIIGSEKATLENVVLKNNRSKLAGGGIFLNSGGTVEFVKNVEITGNEAGTTGGGIYFAPAYGTVFEINGNVIVSGNTASTSGNGIYVASGAVEFSGGAQIDSSNDVYLNNAKIKIAGNLTNNNVATITPATYSTETEVLTDTTSGTLVASNYMKFRVTPSATEDWGVGSSGKLISAKGSAANPLAASSVATALSGATGEVTLTVKVDNDNDWSNLSTAISSFSTQQGNENVMINIIISESSQTKKMPFNVKNSNLGALDGCKNLKSVVLPSSIEEIEDYAFAGTTNLKTIVIPKNVKKIGKGIFDIGSYGGDAVGITSVIFEETENWYVSTTGYSGGSLITPSSIFDDAEDVATKLRGEKNGNNAPVYGEWGDKYLYRN